MKRTSFEPVAVVLGVAVAFATLVGPAFAQYKYVGSDGRITYSDQPPPTGAKVIDEKRLGRGGVASTPTVLPFALQAASSKYPVTIYTGDKCPPCEEGRNYLRTRGIPFTEKTVTSPEDIALFKQQSPDGTAPVLSVGSRKATGFAQGTWSSILDDAGYPATSVLPATFQNAVPTALSPSTQAASAAVGAQDAARRTTPPATRPGPTPPASSTPGFRF